MSFSQDGRSMDQASSFRRPVKRARERAMAGKPDGEDLSQVDKEEESWPSRPDGLPITAPSRFPRPQVLASLQTKDRQVGMAISRPTQVPQWPLRGPSPSSSSSSDSYQPPAGASQPPQRPPRPSRVPSILDASRIQEPTPAVFPFQSSAQRESTNEMLSVPSVPQTPSSRPSTISSVGSIPDFPVPAATPMGPPRRSVNLGPPPSARRGASSFYSNASFVSPIPEESPRSRSRESYASSAAMPDGWATDSPGFSPQDPETFFDERVRDSSIYDPEEFEDENQLVRSASVGKRGVPSLVVTTGQQRPSPSPIQPHPLQSGTGYLGASSSSSEALPTTRTTANNALTPDTMLGAFEAASSPDPSSVRKVSPPPRGFSRLSAIRRPPKLDIDAVREAESRGSLTSLPELIRRATRLAAMIEKGRRPTSRIDMDDFPANIYAGGWDPNRDQSFYDKHQSGLSDMLAAFPPPAQASSNRRSTPLQSLRQSVSTSWPLPLTRSANNSREQMPTSSNNGSPAPESKEGKKRRKCCGLPLWLFVIIVIAVILLIAAAVIIPLYFFVFQNNNDDAQSSLSDCQAQLTCANGGTNVVSQGQCSCLCTNGFTGSNCTVAGSSGCTIVTIDSTDSNNISNVTLGQAIPRLIQSAQTNFSIPLSASAIAAKFNTAELSCTSENELVTLGGSAGPEDELSAASIEEAVAVVANQLLTITIAPGGSSTTTLNLGAATNPAFSGISTIFITTRTFGSSISDSTSSTQTTQTQPTTSATTAASSASASSTFAADDLTLDFARVAVLFILQEQSLDNAGDAQQTLQEFLSDSNPLSSASNITLQNGNTADLVNFRVDIGGGPVGGRTS